MSRELANDARQLELETYPAIGAIACACMYTYGDPNSVFVGVDVDVHIIICKRSEVFIITNSALHIAIYRAD